MRESLRKDIDSLQGLTNDVRQFVKSEKNSAYNPAVSTAEVAEQFDISEEEAHDALEESLHLNKKPVGDTHIWW